MLSSRSRPLQKSTEVHYREGTVLTTAVEAPERSLLWSHEVLGLHVIVDSAGSVRLGAPDQDWNVLLPLVEVTVTGHGRTWSGERFIDTVIGERLTYRGHETGRDGDWQCTTIRLADPVTGLAVDITLRTYPGAGFLRSQVRLVNEGSAPLRLETVSSLALGGMADATGGLEGLTLHWADNEWLAECRWRQAAFREHVVALNRSAHGHEGAAASSGTRRAAGPRDGTCRSPRSPTGRVAPGSGRSSPVRDGATRPVNAKAPRTSPCSDPTTPTTSGTGSWRPARSSPPSRPSSRASRPVAWTPRSANSPTTAAVSAVPTRTTRRSR